MEWGTGLKSGAASGAIYGVIAGILGYIYMLTMKEDVIARIQAAIPQGVSIPMSMDDLYNISLIAAVPSTIISGVILGLILGVVFMLMKEELMGKNLRLKGVFLTGFILVVAVVWELLYPQNLFGGFLLLRFSPIFIAPLSAIAFLAFGYLLGMFCERFEKKGK